MACVGPTHSIAAAFTSAPKSEGYGVDPDVIRGTMEPWRETKTVKYAYPAPMTYPAPWAPLISTYTETFSARYRDSLAILVLARNVVGACMDLQSTNPGWTAKRLSTSSLRTKIFHPSTSHTLKIRSRGFESERSGQCSNLREVTKVCKLTN